MVKLKIVATFFILISCAHQPQNLAPIDQIVVIGTNDFHGYLQPQLMQIEEGTLSQGGASTFAGYVRILQKKYEDQLILLDAGDLFQGTLESNSFLGKPVIEFYNLLPYQAVAVGNHEFDYGPRHKLDSDRRGALKDRIKEANFPFLAANIFEDASTQALDKTKFLPSTLLQIKNYKIGIIGLTTRSAATKTSATNIKGLTFEELREPTLRESQKLRSQGAHVIILLAHEGGEKPGGPLYELIQSLPEGTLDAVVSGHDHAMIHEKILNVPTIQSGTKGVSFGRIDLFIDRKKGKLLKDRTTIYPPQSICLNWLANENTCDRKRAQELLKSKNQVLPLRTAIYEGESVQMDSQVRDLLRPYFAKVSEIRSEILAHASEDFQWSPSSPRNEVGELFILASFRQFPFVKAVYHNGGGIRKKLLKGPITYGDLYEVHPFDNAAVAVKMNGLQLKELLRVGLSGAYPIPVVGGIQATYFDSENEEYLRDINGDGLKEPWEKNRLATLVWEKTGKPVKDSESFWVATNDYLAAGGDNTAHVFNGILDGDRKISDTLTRNMLAQFLRKRRPGYLPPQTPTRLQAIKPKHQN